MAPVRRGETHYFASMVDDGRRSEEDGEGRGGAKYNTVIQFTRSKQIKWASQVIGYINKAIWTQLTVSVLRNLYKVAKQCHCLTTLILIKIRHSNDIRASNALVSMYCDTQIRPKWSNTAIYNTELNWQCGHVGKDNAHHHDDTLVVQPCKHHATCNSTSMNVATTTPHLCASHFHIQTLPKKYI